MGIREMLRELKERGHDVRILGATIFDSPQGITRIRKHWEKIQETKHALVTINDGQLQHRLIKTRSTTRADMRADEEARWYSAYVGLLDKFKPDIVMYYGGRTLDLLIGDEAHSRGISVAAFLYNGNFSGTRWCRNVDTIITDSQATAQHYKEKDGITVTAVGQFVDTNAVVASKRTRENVLFINPSLAKGAAIVASLASRMATERPEIRFEIVESRGSWQQVLSAVVGEKKSLQNVTVTKNTTDMRPIYARAKLILVPSLWWESFPRVAIEAMMNGIPAIATDRGGLPEIIGNAGKIYNLPETYYKAPYNKVPDSNIISKISRDIQKIVDDDNLRIDLEQKARGRAPTLNKQSSVDRLLDHLALHWQ
jgi:glycosyltransferase involved in cell wall biosynthesis